MQIVSVVRYFPLKLKFASNILSMILGLYRKNGLVVVKNKSGQESKNSIHSISLKNERKITIQFNFKNCRLPRCNF